MSPLARRDRRRRPAVPFVFVDRSLGRLQVPELLRAGGLDVITLAEHYGVPQDEQIEDERWIEDASRRGWVVFAKDQRIRRRPAEKAAIQRHGARCFYITRGDLRSAEMADRFLRNIDEIATACMDSGPFIYAVHLTRIERMTL